jgi:general secretion pathway protein C
LKTAAPLQNSVKVPSGARSGVGSALLSVARYRTAAPQIVTAVLGCVLAASMAKDGLALWRVKLVSVAPSHASAVGSRLVGRSWSMLVGAHLFGAPPTATAATAASAAEVDLALSGTLSTPDAAHGYAIIGTRGAPPQIRSVGEAISQGIVLSQVYADHVVVEREGQLRSIFLPRSDVPAAAEVGGPPDDSAIAQHQVAETDSTLLAESTRMAAVMQEQPFYSDDQLRGIRIEAGTNPELIGRLGLKTGDVISHVDGQVISDPGRLNLLRTRLASGESVHVTLIRPGEGPMDVTVNSATVSNLIN